MSARRDARIFDAIEQIPTRERLRHVEAWLRENFPTAMPVRVRVEKLARLEGRPLDGESYVDGTGRRIAIRISRDLERSAATETLLHEYAHAMVWPTAFAERHRCRVEDHSEVFWAAFGRLYRAFYDGTGWKDCSGFGGDDQVLG